MPELPGLPTAGPTDLARVKAALTVTGTSYDTRITDVVNAVNALVRSWRIAAQAQDLSATADPARAWPTHIVQGATMLATRLWRRKDSPSGVEAVTDVSAIYVQRNDPDIALLLGLQAPTVG